jgi:hypothetical protein
MPLSDAQITKKVGATAYELEGQNLCTSQVLQRAQNVWQGG